MKSYNQLTRLGEIRRIRQLALNALKQYDLEVERMRFVAWWTHPVFRLRTKDGRSYAIRICEPGWRTDTDLLSEAMWLEALHRDSDIGAPAPVAARNGSYFVKATDSGVPQPRNCFVMTWVPGAMLIRQRLNEPILHAAGELFAQLHELALSFKSPKGFTTRRMDRVYAREEKDVLFETQFRDAFTPRSREIFERAQARVEEVFEQLYRDVNDLRVIHNDLWYENIKIYRSRLYPFDFEDTLWGYPVQDMATSLLDLMLDTDVARYPPLRQAFKQGYEAHATWPERYTDEIDTFMVGCILPKVEPYRFAPPEKPKGQNRRLGTDAGKISGYRPGDKGQAMNTSRPIYRHEEIAASSGMVVAQHKEAARIGVEVLQSGGNAVDAAVTTAFATGVLLPVWNGIGGGGVMVVHLADGQGGVIDFGMQAPGSAHPEMYELESQLVVDGVSRRFSFPKVKDGANRDGYTAIAIPGTLAGLCTALDNWGSISLDQAIAPATTLAREGFPLPRTEALTMSDNHGLLSRFEATREVYLKKNGSPLGVGNRFVQTDYADTLERIGKNGPEEFYGGKTGARICEDVSRNGGYLTLDDLVQYRPIVHDQPLQTQYRDLTVSGVPGPCAGPTVLEILNILNTFDLKTMDRVDFLHTLIEAVKLAAVDRFTFMGDPAIYGFPCNVLADSDYGRSRAETIDPAAATEFAAGTPWSYADTDRPDGFPAPAGVASDDGTTHITVADSDGNAVALTQTNLGFSGVVNPGVGVMMNNGMGWSCPVPGTVNSIAPHARALNNMTPVICHRDGRVVLALGASGGRRIWPAVVQMIVNRIDLGMSLQEAMEQPRVHVESDDPIVDQRWGDDVIDALKRRGHRVSIPPDEWVLFPFSEPNGIARDGNEWKSGLTPMAKPTHAAGY